MRSINTVCFSIKLFIAITFCCLLPLSAIANTGEIITVDNLDDLASAQGYWATSGGQDPHSSNSIYSLNSTFLWEADLSTEGEYIVEAYWTKWSNRSEQANYEITHANGSDNVSVNQRTTGAEWVELGRYQFTAGRYGVTLSNNDPNNTTLNADAVRFIQVVESKPDGIIEVDNLDANVIREGDWATSYGLDPYLGNSEYSHKYATFTWLPKIDIAGRYQVQAYWTKHSTRTIQALYKINHANGSSTAAINQSLDTGKWVSLGAYYFNLGTTAIALRNGIPARNQTLNADAIRLIPVPESATDVSENLLGDKVTLSPKSDFSAPHAYLGMILKYNNNNLPTWFRSYAYCDYYCPYGSTYGGLTRINNKGIVVSVAQFIRDYPIFYDPGPNYGRLVDGWFTVVSKSKNGEISNSYSEDLVGYFGSTQFKRSTQFPNGYPMDSFYLQGPQLLRDIQIDDNNHIYFENHQANRWENINDVPKTYYVQNYWLDDSFDPDEEGYMTKAQVIPVYN